MSSIPAVRVMGWLLLIPALGCQPQPASPPGVTRSGSVLPPDFALQFHVAGNPASKNPLQLTSQYVLESNRRLYIATGQAASKNLFPPLARVITHAQYERLAHHVMQCHLMAEPTSPGATENANNSSLRYEVTLVANGQSHRYATTPAESPPTVQLLQMLVKSQSPEPGRER